MGNYANAHEHINIIIIKYVYTSKKYKLHNTISLKNM